MLGSIRDTQTAKERGAKGGRAKKGKKTKATEVKEALLKLADEGKLTSIDDLKQGNLEQWLWLRKHAKTFTEKLAVEKELAKYLHPQKREHTGELKQDLTVNFKY